MAERVISGIIFVPILILVTRLGGGFFLTLVNMILVTACWEFYRLMEAKGVHPSKKLGVFAVLALSTLVYATGTQYLGLFLVLFVGTIMVRELSRPKMTFPIYDIATTIVGVVYVGWLMVHLVLLREMPREIFLDYSIGAHFVLYTFLLAWSCDTGAFIIGIPLGRHKLLPSVSPAKSVEGAIGGFAAAVGAAQLGRVWFVRHPGGEPLLSVSEALALGAIVGITTQLGDLVESLLKRDAHVKDASDTIPGHGGVLDRFDGLLFSAPVAFYFLRLVVFR